MKNGSSSVFNGRSQHQKPGCWEFAAGPCPELFESTPHPRTILLFTIISLKSILTLLFHLCHGSPTRISYHPNICCISSISHSTWLVQPNNIWEREKVTKLRLTYTLPSSCEFFSRMSKYSRPSIHDFFQDRKFKISTRIKNRQKYEFLPFHFEVQEKIKAKVFQLNESK
jgi:hypothetical protein